MPEELADAAQLLEEVAIVEMHHMGYLAELIKLLGQPPMYMDGQIILARPSFLSAG